jgi:hypothetical protein
MKNTSPINYSLTNEGRRAVEGRCLEGALLLIRLRAIMMGFVLGTPLTYNGLGDALTKRSKYAALQSDMIRKSGQQNAAWTCGAGAKVRYEHLRNQNS